jgi:RNA polymerase sigma factor (sigma-70 family)
LNQQERAKRVEQVAMPHLDAAYNLARWLLRSEPDARDVVQEAYLRALRFIDGYRGGNGRAWLLAIVRNCAFTWLRQRGGSPERPLGESEGGQANEWGVDPDAADPETTAIEKADREMWNRAIAALPIEFRDVLILRELEDLSYKEIAAITDSPIGTVMSRLARARKQLGRIVAAEIAKGVSQ